MTKQGTQTPPETVVVKRFIKYNFFKVARDWRFLGPDEKATAKKEFLKVLKRQVSVVELQYFSLVGYRRDVDFMVMAGSPDVQRFQDLFSELVSTSLGRYLETPYSYLAMTRRSTYLGSHTHPGQEGAGHQAESGSKYLFVYPFVKKREWYSIPFRERQRMMADHFKIGHKYPKIKINTGYSFGLDDQEFVLAFEGDDPSEFLALVEELRSSDVSRYTQLEVPVFTCSRVSEARMLDLIA
ncbi:MAG TPA: chlorite dismutase family protein [Nitrososphaerales archaeon]|nr:chlorite dismutase family protein [Nitrososphaerales archaeon]